MRSWQARILEIYLIVKRRFGDPSGKLDVARERADVESMAGLFKPLHAIRCQAAVANGVRAEWIVPEGPSPSRAVLFLHGGSFNSGSISSHRTLAGNVAFASKARALLIDYRLAPEHPFPAAVEDSVAAYEWLLGQGCASSEIVVARDSAGGTLALALLIFLRDHNRPLPAAAVCLSPAPDLTFSGDSWAFNARKDLMLDERKERQAIEIYLRGADPRAPLASPTFGDLAGLPPLLIQVGSHEMLLSDAARFAENARQAGVDVTLEVWPEVQHEWQFAARVLPEGRQAILKVGAFVETACSSSGQRARTPAA
ncbi:MAG: alpha/beta hydrolase [Chloroflexi bacterium]|nr:alpha/beta hydrolase [Chloroflexota bacterium]